MRDLTDEEINQEYFLSNGWEIFQKNMEPHALNKVRYIEYLLRLDGIPTHELLTLEWNFAYSNQKIHRDKSYIKNIPLFDGKITDTDQFEMLMNMIDSKL